MTFTVSGTSGLTFPDASTQPSTAIGNSQTWTSFTVGSTRVSGTTYTNSTGRPILVLICGYGNGAFYVNGTSLGGYNVSGNVYGSIIIPNGATYMSNITSMSTWWELR